MYYCPAHLHEDNDRIIKLIPHLTQQLEQGCREKGWHPKAMDCLQAFAYDAAVRGPEAEYELTVLAGTHLLLSQTQWVWWLQKDVLVEYAFIRYGNRPIIMDHVFRGIDSLARDRGVSTVVMSTSASVRNEAYSRLLRRYGYTLGAHQHIKEIA